MCSKLSKVLCYLKHRKNDVIIFLPLGFEMFYTYGNISILVVGDLPNYNYFIVTFVKIKPHFFVSLIFFFPSLISSSPFPLISFPIFYFPIPFLSSSIFPFLSFLPFCFLSFSSLFSCFFSLVFLPFFYSPGSFFSPSLSLFFFFLVFIFSSYHFFSFPLLFHLFADG